MKKGRRVLLILFIIIVVVGIAFLLWKKGILKIDFSINTNNTVSDTNNQTVNDTVLELSVKKALIEVVNEKHYKDITDKTGTTAAEGHKILRSEIKDNQIYAYVVAEYGVYQLEKGKSTPVSASASPITLILDRKEENGYTMIKYLLPSDGGDAAWLSSLKEMFPADLIDEARAVNYTDDFYQNQIKSYLETLKSTSKTGTQSTTNNVTNNTNEVKQVLLSVMNNKQKLINEDNKEVLLKEFKIVENQTAKVDKYAFVDLDGDGVQELVIYTTSDYGAYVILHYENSKVYGYMIEVRSLENLKADGSFMGSSGANSNEYLRMTFNKNSYSTKTEAVYDGTNKIYKINGEIGRAHV